MKFAVGIILFCWLVCGLLGAWMMEDLDRDHWKNIAWGPFTLAQAVHENPANVPGIPN